MRVDYIKIFFLIISAAVIVMSGCKTSRHTHSHSSYDSSYVETVRPERVAVPGDSVQAESSIRLQNTFAKPGVSSPVFHSLSHKVTGIRSELTMSVDTLGILFAKCKCLEDSVDVLVKDTRVSVQKKSNTDSVKVKYRTRRIDLFCRGFTGVFFLLALLWLAFRLGRKKNLNNKNLIK